MGISVMLENLTFFVPPHMNSLNRFGFFLWSLCHVWPKLANLALSRYLAPYLWLSLAGYLLSKVQVHLSDLIVSRWEGWTPVSLFCAVWAGLPSFPGGAGLEYNLHRLPFAFFTLETDRVTRRMEGMGTMQSLKCLSRGDGRAVSTATFSFREVLLVPGPSRAGSDGKTPPNGCLSSRLSSVAAVFYRMLREEARVLRGDWEWGLKRRAGCPFHHMKR